jgi:hypothetical protein
MDDRVGQVARANPAGFWRMNMRPQWQGDIFDARSDRSGSWRHLRDKPACVCEAFFHSRSLARKLVAAGAGSPRTTPAPLSPVMPLSARPLFLRHWK